MAIGTFGSSLFGNLIYLADIVCRPGAQNVVGGTELIRSRRQAMGVGVRKADGGPKTSEL